MPDPSTVFVAPEVPPENIAPGTVVHPFCRLSGSRTSIGPGCELGAEGPATIVNCQLGAGVSLAGGYFCGATFLDNSSVGSCAHVRPGTLLEERASAAHAVGLKQTVLFPYVVLGSLINFCDCLMAGGTGRKLHGEVGSSYVHFNYTPRRDKATPSLVGDVVSGVFLDQPPAFLGGQGGLVGPARVAFGAVIPAGVVRRGDVLSAGLVAPENSVRPAPAAFSAGAYRSIGRTVLNNLVYIGNICALAAWYRGVRARFMSADKYQAACLAGALEQLGIIVRERISRLDELASKMPESVALNSRAGAAGLPYVRQQEDFARLWPEMKDKLSTLAQYDGDRARRDAFLGALSPSAGPYLEVVPALVPETKAAGRAWLKTIVDRAAGIWKTEF